MIFMMNLGHKERGVCSGVLPLMPRYFFNIDAGRLIEDDIGETLFGPAEAQSGAINIMSEMMKDYPPNQLSQGRLCVTVVDEDRRQIFAVETTTRLL